MFGYLQNSWILLFHRIMENTGVSQWKPMLLSSLGQSCKLAFGNIERKEAAPTNRKSIRCCFDLCSPWSTDLYGNNNAPSSKAICQIVIRNIPAASGDKTCGVVAYQLNYIRMECHNRAFCLNKDSSQSSPKYLKVDLLPMLVSFW